MRELQILIPCLVAMAWMAFELHCTHRELKASIKVADKLLDRLEEYRKQIHDMALDNIGRKK